MGDMCCNEAMNLRPLDPRSLPQRGFTLIELMIVVTILGIVAVIAVPSYGDYVRRGNRTVAKAVLMDVASRQESWLTDRKTYATTLSALGYPADTFYVGKGGTPSASATGAIYSVTLSAATATSFTVQAVAKNSQTKDTGCTTMGLNSLGQRTPATGDCWTR